MGIIYTSKEVDEWSAFEHDLRVRNRFIPSNPDYIAALVDRCMRSRFILPANTSLYRARLMPLEHSLSYEPLSPDLMGPPPLTAASGGRLNPEGIQCLYVALEEETAVAEVRPWPSARITIAHLKTPKELSLVDLTPDLARQGTDDDFRLRFVATLVARPTHREDRWAYLGTQFLAEALKSRGVLGLAYRSAVHPEGRNVAFFPPLQLSVERTKLVETWAVTYKYSTPSPPR